MSPAKRIRTGAGQLGVEQLQCCLDLLFILPFLDKILCDGEALLYTFLLIKRVYPSRGTAVQAGRESKAFLSLDKEAAEDNVVKLDVNSI